MTIQASWLWRGYFDLSSEDSHDTTTQRIRDDLCAGLKRPAASLHIKTYPVGPVWKHTFWWREGESDYAEAQFFLQIARHYPVLSLGVSVEKGPESPDINASDPQRLDRGTWDWQRFVRCSASVIETDIPALAADLQQPITVRFRVAREHRALEDDSRAFSYVESGWFERHHGRVEVADIVAHVNAVDRIEDHWVDTYFALDVPAPMAERMSPTDVAQLLLRFEPLRRRLRGQPCSASQKAQAAEPTIEWIEVTTVKDLVLGHGFQFGHREAGPIAFIEGYPFFKEPWAVIPVRILVREPNVSTPATNWATVVQETKDAVTTIFAADSHGRRRLRHGRRVGKVTMLINA